jgi:anti-sigma factor RsiW
LEARAVSANPDGRMSQESLHSFDDPALKVALKRACSPRKAPDSLRARIQAVVAREAAAPAMRLADPDEPADVIGTIGRPRQWWGYRLAVAAVLLLALGAPVYYFGFHDTGGGPAQHAYPVSDAGMSSLVKRHDGCGKGHPQHHMLEAPADNFAAIGKELSAKLGYPVLVADLRDDGWKFRGAAICPVNDQAKAAHLIFDRDGQTLSVFTIPASACGGKAAKDGDCYCCEKDQHPMAGFIQKGVLYTMVVHCPSGAINKDEVAQLLRKHRNDIVALADERWPALAQ